VTSTPAMTTAHQTRATRLKLRDLPEHPGKHWAISHARAVMWRYEHQWISSSSEHVHTDQRSAIVAWAYHAAWHSWGTAFEIPYSGRQGAMTQFPDPEYDDDSRAKPTPTCTHLFERPASHGGRSFALLKGRHS
jgi:hypothetical protein